jgi:hypothetical protein
VNVGIYTIIPSGLSSSNYKINYVDGTLTINPAPINPAPINPVPINPGPINPAPINPAPIAVGNLDALGTAANAAGTLAPSTVMNATILPSPTSLPGNVSSGSNTVLPYGNDAGVVGDTNQQTSNSANTNQQTSKKRNGSTNQQTSNKRNGGTNRQTNTPRSTNQQTSNTSDRRTN